MPKLPRQRILNFDKNAISHISVRQVSMSRKIFHLGFLFLNFISICLFASVHPFYYYVRVVIKETVKRIDSVQEISLMCWNDFPWNTRSSVWWKIIQIYIWQTSDKGTYLAQKRKKMNSKWNLFFFLRNSKPRYFEHDTKLIIHLKVMQTFECDEWLT